jgi:hypothetical protein
MIARSSWAWLLLVFIVGCKPGYIDLYACEYPDLEHVGPDGKPDPCYEQDVDGGADCGADSGASCGAGGAGGGAGGAGGAGGGTG